MVNVTYNVVYHISSCLFNLALILIAKVSDIGVIASIAVFLLSSSAPAMIVVSSRVNSPPLPAYTKRLDCFYFALLLLIC